MNEVDRRNVTSTTLKIAKEFHKKNTVKAYIISVKLWKINLSVLTIIYFDRRIEYVTILIFN